MPVPSSPPVHTQQNTRNESACMAMGQLNGSQTPKRGSSVSRQGFSPPVTVPFSPGYVSLDTSQAGIRTLSLDPFPSRGSIFPATPPSMRLKDAPPKPLPPPPPPPPAVASGNASVAHAPSKGLDRHLSSSSTFLPLPSTPQAPPVQTHAPSAPGEETKNIVVFGETGVGKSSVINMIRGSDSEETAHQDQAPVSSGAVGCTFSSKGYAATLAGQKYMFWDTAGLNEGMRGTVTHQKSVLSLVALLEQLGGKVHLLVYCIRGKRFRQVIKDNYDLFFTRVCKGRVPIVLVVTGLENEEPDMDNWWYDNRRDLANYGLSFRAHACITATRGKPLKEGGFIFDEEYDESKEKVLSLMKVAGTGYHIDTSQVDLSDPQPHSAPLYRHVAPVVETSEMVRQPSSNRSLPGGAETSSIFKKAIGNMFFHAEKLLENAHSAFDHMDSDPASPNPSSIQNNGFY